MKSAAFNLAFKVHRNEMPFAEGLLKSVEAEAQHDFIEALNSLAGEVRYDMEKMDALIEEARQNLQPKKKPKYDIKALKDEIKQIKKNRNEIKETIHSLEARIAALKPTVIPGINAFFIAVIGLVFILIFYLVNLIILSLLGFVGILVGALIAILHDMSVLKKQQAEIGQKKIRYMSQITQYSADCEKLDETIQGKTDFLKSVRPIGSDAEDDDSES